MGVTYSCTSPLPHGEWADGTAVYYWLHHPVFGVTEWSAFIASAVVEVPLLVVGLTWGTIAIEFALALVLLLPRLARPWIMGLGAALHLGIGFTLGLWSFSIAMLAALLVLCATCRSEHSVAAAGLRAR